MINETQINNNMSIYNIYDTLTHTPNNFYFFELLNKTIKEAIISNKKGAFIYIDIDNYKLINSTFGHSMGNSTLKLFAELINNILGEAYLFSRLNGDEFAILVPDFNDINIIKEICCKIQEELKKPFKVNNNEIHITVSMGISIFPDNSVNTDELFKFCDFAMYESKHKGKNIYTFFNNKISDTYYRQAFIKNELINAIDKNELYILYQPQIHALTNKVIGMEALLRWNNNKLGNVSPDEFIPIAEKNGYIFEIGNWVLETVLKQTSLWIKKGYKFNNISVNISPVQLNRTDFNKILLNTCYKYDIPPSLVEIEITEGTLIDIYKDRLKVLNELTEYGFNIALDDFGTGYSSLNYLVNLPINTLKIDKSFIDNIENHKNKAVIKSIVDLSKSLNYKIITEGVETKKQLEILTDFQCNIIQGYYFSKPISENETEKLLVS